jgi:hypothetical protein
MTESPADATLEQRLDYLQLPYLKPIFYSLKN